MNEKQIKVKILSDGITAKEVNPFGEYIDYITVSENSSTVTVNTHRAEKWNEAEASLRTFFISNTTKCGKSIILQLDSNGIAAEQLSVPGSVHTAEIIDYAGMQIKIID